MADTPASQAFNATGAGQAPVAPLPDTLQKTDYAAVNLARGVKTEDVEHTARQPKPATPQKTVATANAAR